MTTNILNYMGRGIAWPIRIAGGRTQQVEGWDLIQQSISRILSTPEGKIIFNPDYGSRLHELFFQPNDNILTNLLHYFIKEAIGKWEKRVSFVDVEFTIDGAIVFCKIHVRINAKDKMDKTFVYPFYRNLEV